MYQHCIQEQRQALAFAQKHDWGARARLEDHYIVNLDDNCTEPDGTFVMRTTSVPATLAAVRDFGGY